MGKLLQWLKPAIATLVKMEGCFADWKGELEGLSKGVQDEYGEGLADKVVPATVAQQIVRNWNRLAQESEFILATCFLLSLGLIIYTANAFVHVAYIAQPDQTALADAVKTLEAGTQ